MKVCDCKQHPLDMLAVVLCLFPLSSDYSTHALPALSSPNPALPAQPPSLLHAWAAHVSCS